MIIRFLVLVTSVLLAHQQPGFSFQKQAATFAFDNKAALLSGLQADAADSLVKNPMVHDPVMIRQGARYYLFCTGMGISVWSSADMEHWKAEKPVFASAPAWAVEAVPGFRNHI